MSQASSDATPYGFAYRAALYASWDAQLRDKTRFFAAAAVTNKILAAAVRIRFPRPLSRSAGEILDSLGSSLEKDNLRLAERLNAGRRTGPLLDERMVEMEQGWVDRFLQETALEAPKTMRRVTAELDALLNLITPWSLCIFLNPAVGGYLRVLRQVRRQVGPPIRFCQQAHRVRIGQRLISCIRAGGIFPAG